MFVGVGCFILKDKINKKYIFIMKKKQEENKTEKGTKKPEIEKREKEY